VPPVSNDLQRNVSPNGGEGAASAIASGGIGTSTDSSLPTVSVTQQRTQSSGLKLTVLAVSQIAEDSLSTDTAGDSPPENLTPAQPKELTQTFPDLVYPASIALNLGRPIQLRVEISSEGQASPIEVRQGSAANDLDNLVQDLIREIPFNPATQSGKPVSSWVDISLKLEPL
jgi:outer membrane biosynthesis protein TonB